MKKTRMTTKALSMFLAAIMLFTTISVGIIVPETKVVAKAAEANSVATLTSAINTANNNGTGVVTEIKLTGNITSTGALNSFPTITGNVRLDMNGYSINITHTVSGDYGSNQMNVQLPSANAGYDYKDTDYMSTAMINVGAGGTLQIVNSGSAEGELRVYTDVYDTDNNSGNDAYHQTSSNVIHSAGTLILGDSADSNKNNFRIYAHSSARNDGDDAWKVVVTKQVEVSTSANAYGVTINGANAVFKMYGGKIDATGVARCYRSAASNLRVYALNVNTCSSAEIYGGSINIPESPIDSYSGLRQSESDASASANAVISAIRCATTNLYIFDVECDVKAKTGADTGKSNSMTISNVYCTDGSPATIYGGSFTYYSEADEGSDNSTASIYNYTIRGSYNGAGNKSLSTSKGSNRNPQTTGRDQNRSASFIAQTVFVHGGALAFNGLNMFDTAKYPTFKDYKSAAESADAATDALGIKVDGTPTATYEDTNNHNANVTGYKRNGYKQSGWIGKTTPNGKLSYTDTSSATVAAGGGSLFLEPTWDLTEYYIDYDLAGNTQYPSSSTAAEYDEAYGKYNIESTMIIPVPVRPGYKFAGWKAAYENDDIRGTDNKISWVNWTAQNNVLYGWNSSAATGTSVNVNGQFGDISLTATWLPVSASATVDNNRDGKADNTFEYSPHIKGEQFDITENFLTNPRLDDYHVFSGYYEIQPTGTETNWKKSELLHVSDVNPDVYPPEVTPLSDEAINDQFIGKYGPVSFTAKFIARPYTITYYDDDESLIETATYTVDNTNKENPDALAVMPNSGRVFRGWELVSSDNNSWPSSIDVFNNFPKGANGNVELKAVYDNASKYSVKFYDEDGTTLITEVPYSYQYGNTVNISSQKPGYEIVGWEIISMEADADDGEANWAASDITVTNGVTTVAARKVGAVSLKVKYTAKTYTITFDSKDNSITPPAAQTYTIEDEIILDNLVKTAYDFDGWKVESCVDGSWDMDAVYKEVTNSHGTEKRLYGDVNLYAVWTPAKYDVTFWLDEDNILADKLPYNTEAAINSDKFPKVHKDGYRFIGWDIKSYDETGWAGFRELIGANKVTQLPKNYYGTIALVADFEPITYTINFAFLDGVTPSKPVAPIQYDVTQEDIYLPSADDVIITGHTMNGWSLPSSKDGWAADDYGFLVAGPGYWGNITLFADVTPTNYKIQYVDSEGNSLGIEDKPYTIKDTVSLSDYIKNGYKTRGWYVFADGQNTGNWRTEVLYDHNATYPGMYGDVKLYPDLELNNYTITFVDNNGSLLGEFDYNIEFEGTLPAYEKAGYVLTGWMITKADGNWQANTIFRTEDVLKGAYGDVTLTAIWNLRSYEITWKNYDGTVLFHGNVNHGAMAEYPDTAPVPVKPADDAYTYEFVGWMAEPQIVTGEATYTAVFKANPRVFEVNWVYPDGTFTSEVRYGDYPVFKDGKMPVKTEDGKIWTFIGWQDEDGKLLDKDTKVTGNVTYTAIFEEKAESTYKITWTVDGIAYDTYWAAGTTPEYPGSPYLPGKNGYINVISEWDPSIKTVTGDADYSAIISPVYLSYDAVFLPMGGQFDGDKVVSYNSGTGLTMPQPVKEGYSFAGWKVVSAENTSWTTDELYKETKYTGKWGEVRFEAQWEINTYSVTIRTDAGTQVQEYTIESADRLPLLSKTGYTHTGWLIYSADENSSWQMGDVIEVNKVLRGMYGNVKVEPVWTAKTYKINWVSGDEILTIEVKFGEEIVPLAPVAKNGYTAKWIEEIPEVMGAKDLTFNAEYSVIEYYLKYNTNGGNAIAGFPYYVTSTESLATPVKEGSTFRGWKVSLGSGSWERNAVYDADFSLEGSYGDVTLTAVWEINSYDITWVVGDVTTVTSWYYGTRPTYNGVPTKPSDDRVSYEFSGKWKTEGGSLVDNSAIPVVTGAAVYEAQFNEVNRRYIITWDIDGSITTQTYFYGDAVICPFVGENTPTRPSTGEFDYTFSGWSPEIGRVTSDITYVAMFEKHVKLQGLSINKSSVFIEVNGTETLTAIMSPSTATSNDVEWISHNRNIATVDENGKIFGVSAGETLVRVQSRDGKFKAYCMVNVIPVLAEYIVVSAAGVSTTRLPGETVQLYATIMPEYASNKVVKWTSSDPEIATVDSNGLVTFGLKVGTATITALSDGYATGSITVTTTTESSDVEGSEKTYIITFVQSSSAYIIGGYTFDSVTLECKEGATLEFLLAEPHFVTLNGYQFERDPDGVYRIEDIKENYTVYATERPDTGFEPDEPDDNGTVKLSFFDRLKAFFRSIIEFFRGLFGG